SLGIRYRCSFSWLGPPEAIVTHRPSGDQSTVSCPASGGSSRNQRSPDPSGRTVTRCEPDVRRIRSPSGVHERTAASPVLSATTPDPSAFITYALGAFASAPSRTVNAILVPSGDHTGSPKSCSRRDVSTTRPVPSGSITAIPEVHFTSRPSSNAYA